MLKRKIICLTLKTLKFRNFVPNSKTRKFPKSIYIYKNNSSMNYKTDSENVTKEFSIFNLNLMFPSLIARSANDVNLM